jgi:threonine aldolase
MTPSRRQFASDNNAGVFPEVIQAIALYGAGHASAYGNDEVTAQAREAVAGVFGCECVVHFAGNGTAANCLGLAAAVQPYEAVLVHEFSHLETDECNALGHFVPGAKLIPVPGEQARIQPETLSRIGHRLRPIHSSRARAVSITNATELGTVYSPAQTAELATAAREAGLVVHLDGARIANAIVHHGCSPADLTWKAGVDVLSFGGTKAGLAFGEAIVFFRRELAHDFEYRLKQSGHLFSKMRFISAQWLGFLENNRWLERSAHANAMAVRLRQGLEQLPEIELLFPTQANAVFAKLPPRVVEGLYRRGWRFYTDVGPGGGARLMCAWDTTPRDVDAFVQDVAGLAPGGHGDSAGTA